MPGGGGAVAAVVGVLVGLLVCGALGVVWWAKFATLGQKAAVEGLVAPVREACGTCLRGGRGYQPVRGVGSGSEYLPLSNIP